MFRYSDLISLNRNTYEFKFSNYNFEKQRSLKELLVKYGFGFVRYNSDTNTYFKHKVFNISSNSLTIFTHPRSKMTVFFTFENTFYMNHKALHDVKERINNNILNDEDLKDNISKEDLQELIKRNVESYMVDYIRDCKFEDRWIICPECNHVFKDNSICTNCNNTINIDDSIYSFTEDCVENIEVKIFEWRGETLFEATIKLKDTEYYDYPLIEHSIKSTDFNDKQLKKEVENLLKRYNLNEVKTVIFKQI